MILSFIYFRAIKSDTEINNERVTSEDSINDMVGEILLLMFLESQ